MRTISWTAFAGALLLASPAFAQTVFPEAETNDSKALANVVSCMVSGDSITGLSTGTAASGGLAASADTFRVKTCAAALGIYQHTMTVTGTGNLGSIRGITQAAGVPNTTTDAAFTPTASATVRWYGFGAQEEIYYRVTGTASSTAGYTATLTNATIAPLLVPGTYIPGASYTVTSVGQGHSTDTEIYLYDINGVEISHSDDFSAIAGQSTVTAVLPAGIYIVAISNYNTSNNQSDAIPPEQFLTGLLLDFPNALANDNATTGTNVAFSVSDGTTTTPVAATKTTTYGVVFAYFQVGTPVVFTSFCSNGTLGVDHTTPCPCANAGAPGNGCAHSFDANGANLTATGTAAADDVLLTSSFEPPTAFTLFMQHDMAGDAVFHDGVLCAGGTLIRLRGRAAAGGQAFFPNPVWDSSITLSQRGSVTVGSGARRYYAAWFRNASTTFCPPATANVTNGWVIDW